MKKFKAFSRPASELLVSGNSQIVIRASGDTAEIDLYDAIGAWGIRASDFKRQLNSIEARTITLNINSPGGDVFDGFAIYNDLIAHPATINVVVKGLAASAASLIAMAGDNIAIADNAFFMIHNAWTIAVGNKAEMDKTSAVLEKIDASLAGTYRDRTGLKLADVVAMMDAETWLDAETAVANGFADGTVSADAKANARFDLSQFKNTPRELVAAHVTPVIEADAPDYSGIMAPALKLQSVMNRKTK